jgi:hypothetical protein
MKLSFQHNHDASSKHRFTLSQGEVLRLPQGQLTLQVISGNAWITMNAKDTVVAAGEVMSLVTTQTSGLVSGLGKTPLVIDVLYSDQSLFCRLQALLRSPQRQNSWKHAIEK